MEHIKNIEIKNFKSIRHQKIEGCKRINVFVGPPNVGKSNVLEALGGFSCMSKSNITNLKDLIRFKNLIELFSDGNSSSAAEISINKNFYLSYKFVSISSVDIVASNMSIEKEETRQYLTSAGINYSSTFKDGGHINRAERKLLAPSVFLKKYDYSINKEYFNSYDQSLVVPFGNNLKDIIESNRKLKTEVIEIFSRFGQKLLFDKSDNGFRIFKFLKDETVFTFPFELVADTLRRLIFYKAAILSNEQTVLLFEEPEANCYEPYIMEITNAIKDDTSNNQFFIVTHSQYVIDELLRDKESRKDTNIYLVGLENSETVIKLLDEETSKDVYEQGLNVFFNFSSLWEETEKV